MVCFSMLVIHCIILKKHRRLVDDFAKLQADHNNKFNNKGTETYKAKKRNIETPDVQPVRIEACSDVDGKVVSENADYCLMIHKDGLYIKGKIDCTAACGPLVLAYGEYHTDGKEHKNSLKFQMNDTKFTGWFMKDEVEGKMTLEDFLKQMENDKVVKPFIAAHELEYDGTGSVAVKATEECVFLNQEAGGQYGGDQSKCFESAHEQHQV